MAVIRNLRILLPLLFLSITSVAQWRDVRGNIDDAFSQGAYFNDMHFFNNDFGWAVGDGSTILMFDGMGWRKQESPKDAASAFYAINFSPDTFGWIVGEGATFYQYNKQNNTWAYFKHVEIDKKDFDKKNRPMIDVRSIYTLSKNNAWAVSSGENIFRFDGKKWLRQTVAGVTEQLYSVTFSGNTGWAVGEQGVILKCTGNKWEKVQSPTTHKLRSVHFESERLGFASGDNGTILKYEDGVWTIMPVIMQGADQLRLRSIYALSNKLAWAVGDKGVVLCYNGKDWSVCKEKVSGNILTKVWFTAAGTGWVCGQSSFLNYEASIDEDMTIQGSVVPTGGSGGSVSQ
jgi:photosystem II stability/assembly factor-like uncharacterized protein